jgi:dihydrofolate reductase
VASSVDGAIAEKNGSFPCFLQIEGEHVTDYLSGLETFDDVLMGRSTYEVGLQFGVTDPYPKLNSYVFSTTRKKSPNERVQFNYEDPAPFTSALKDQPGRDIYLCGGGAMASTVLAARLIDQIIIKLNPLLIGPGISLFSHIAKPVFLRLLAHKVYDNGVVLLTYHPQYERTS